MGGLAAHHSKVSKQARLVESKTCFISAASNWWGGWRTSVQWPAFPLLTLRQAVGESFYRQSCSGEVTCRNSTVISNSHLQLVISGLTSIIWVVLGTVTLHFQGAFVPISLWSGLRIVAAHVLDTVWSSCS